MDRVGTPSTLPPLPTSPRRVPGTVRSEQAGYVEEVEGLLRRQRHLTRELQARVEALGPGRGPSHAWVVNGTIG